MTPPNDQLTLDAKRFISRGLWGVGVSAGAVALLVVTLLVLSAFFGGDGLGALRFFAKIAALPFLGVLFGSIRAAQGWLMLLTGMRIELEGRHRLNGGETALTGVFAVGWVVAVVGSFALIMAAFH